VQNNSKQQKSLYEGIFGVQAYSIKGPLFYFGLGVISALIFVSLLFVGAYVPGVANDTELLRPDLTFPFIGFLVILSLSGAVTGIVLGLIGFFWKGIMEH
jgi:hypothetical protein